MQLVKNADGSVGPTIVGYVPNVDQSFGGSFEPNKPAAWPHLSLRARSEDAVAGQDQGGQERQDHERGRSSRTLTEAPQPNTPSRPSACGGSAGGSAVFMPCATSISTSRTASAARSSARTAPARRRSSTSSAGDFPPSSGTRRALRRGRHRAARAQARELGLARTYQQSRMFLGLTVEDTIYLSILGVDGRPAAAGAAPARTARSASARVTAAGRVAIDHKLSELVGILSHGEHRQVAIAMALAAEPRMLMLDEPGSGLSRGERQLLTDLLLGLDREITLILIEHDMDVALRVAERVTMMHDGRVIVEGTPDEIRANELVHDLYLGRGNHGMSRWRPLLDGRGAERVLRQRAVPPGRVVRDRRAVRRDRRPKRDGEDDALCRDHGPQPSAGDRLGPVRRQGAGRDEPRTRSPGSGIGYVPQGRRLFPSLTVDEHLKIVDPRRNGDGQLDDRADLRALPASRGAEAERRRAALGRRAADARDRPRARHQPEATDHGRAVRGACADDHRDADRDVPAARGGGAADPADRAEPRRRDLDRRAAAGDGRRRDRGRDDGEPSSRATPSSSAATSASSRSRADDAAPRRSRSPCSRRSSSRAAAGRHGRRARRRSSSSAPRTATTRSSARRPTAARLPADEGEGRSVDARRAVLPDRAGLVAGRRADRLLERPRRARRTST